MRRTYILIICVIALAVCLTMTSIPQRIRIWGSSKELEHSEIISEVRGQNGNMYLVLAKWNSLRQIPGEEDIGFEIYSTGSYALISKRIFGAGWRYDCENVVMRQGRAKDTIVMKGHVRGQNYYLERSFYINEGRLIENQIKTVEETGRTP